jgi:hypothetical protein
MDSYLTNLLFWIHQVGMVGESSSHPAHPAVIDVGTSKGSSVGKASSSKDKTKATASSSKAQPKKGNSTKAQQKKKAASEDSDDDEDVPFSPKTKRAAKPKK